MQRINPIGYALALLLPILLSACEAPPPPPPPITVKAAPEFTVGINTWAGHAPGLWANGGLTTQPGSIYQKLGLKVTFTIIDDPAEKLKALEAGTIDVMWDTVDSWAREASAMAATKKPGAKAILLQDWSRGGDGVVAEAAIKTIEDLAGKKVAVIEHSPSHWLILYLLAQSGLSADERATVALTFFPDPATVKEAYVSGSVAAMVSWQPFLAEALAAKGGKGHLLVSTTAATNLIADTLVASGPALATKSEGLQALVSGWLEGMAAMGSDATAVHTVVGTALKLPPTDVAGMLGDLKLTPYADNAQFFGLTGGKAHFEMLFKQALALYRSLGAVTTMVEAKDCVDTRYLAALAQKYAGQTVQEKEVAAPAGEGSTKDRGLLNKQLSINFVPGSAELMAGSEYMLDAVGELMMSMGATFVQIEGNTDSTGARKFNVELSKRRAETVKTYLMKAFQLPASRFRTMGLGPDNPVASNKNEAGRQKNRRTDIKVMVAAEAL